MTGLDELCMDETASLTLYADDIAYSLWVDWKVHRRIKAWAKKFSLTFYPTKSQLLSLKGGLKPTYSVGFGTGTGDSRINASETVKYLWIMLDSWRSYWNHVVYLKDKSKDLYTSLRQMTSADWGMGREAARIIYEVVLLPRIIYAAQIWAPGCNLQKAIKLLGSIQRAPLLAITSCYRISSTNC